MRRVGWSFLGPWPLRAGWLFILVFIVQVGGLAEVRVQASSSYLATMSASLVGIGLQRAALGLGLAACVVAAEWAVWRLTTRGRTAQAVPAYVAMIVAGALAATAFRVGVQYVDGIRPPVPPAAATFLHYLILLIALHISIGVIGSRVSASAARAEDALAQLGEQERRFVASEERARRIAAEFLHDRVQADLLVIAMELRRVAADAPDDLARRLASITESVESVRHDDVRDTSRALSPMVQATGLASALTALSQRWDPAMRITVSIEEGIPARSLDDSDPDPALGIYRIVEQAVLNAAAHGHARQVQVSISRQERNGVTGARILVTDDGDGFDPSEVVKGGGFATSQVWARLLDGEWSVASRPGAGATVTAWVSD